MTTAIGRLTMKIQCQLMASVIAPPASSPIEPPAEATKRVDADRPACSPRSGNMVTIMPRMTAEVSAPPMPWMKRATTSTAWLSATPAGERGGGEEGESGEEDAPAAEEVAEPAGQQQQAAEGDQVGVDDPGEARLREAEVVWIEGSATFTIVASRTIISMPAQRTTRAIQRERSEVDGD